MTLNKKALLGQTFDKLKVVKFAGQNKKGKSLWDCKCSCGKTKTVLGYHLKSGATRSCGCLVGDKNPLKDDRHPFYRSWEAMKRRCDVKTDKQYKDYGGRGITYSLNWKRFPGFYKDMFPTYKKGLTIDRINNNGNYSKENCRWTTVKVQNRNRRSNVMFEGKCASDVCKENGWSNSCISSRIKSGWSLEKAFLTPKKGILGHSTRT